MNPQRQRVRAVADSIIAQPTPYALPHSTRYLLPCPLLGLGGLYEYVLIDAAQATSWLTSGPYQNHLTHPFLRAACETLLQVPLVEPTRGLIPALDYHDDALVFSVAGYEAPWALWRGDSQQVQEALEMDLITLGLLGRLA